VKVGRPHGLDGSFYVDGPLFEGDVVTIEGAEYTVVGRKGTDSKPIVRLSGVDDRDAAERLRGQAISTGAPEPPGEGEWLVNDLIGCEVVGVGRVTDVLGGTSCDVLEVGDQLIPLVTDAVTSVDIERKVIEVDREFLGL
jgi:16S rRNA processing protein RimM